MSCNGIWTCSWYLIKSTITPYNQPHDTRSTNKINGAVIHIVNIVVICDTMYCEGRQNKTSIVRCRHYHSNRVYLELWSKCISIYQKHRFLTTIANYWCMHSLHDLQCHIWKLPKRYFLTPNKTRPHSILNAIFGIYKVVTF